MKKNDTLLSINVALCIFAVLILYCQPVIAQDDEIVRLRQKISHLEKRIDDLENLLAVYGEPNNIQAEGPGWQNKKNWRKLKAGMTREQVQSILGEPVKAIHGVRTLWYYPNIYCGYVSFDENGVLAGWNEP